MGVLQSTLTPVCPHNPSSPRRKETNSSIIHGFSDSSRGCRPGALRREISRGVFPPFYGPQKERFLEASHRPDIPELLHQEGKIQDGDTANNSSDNTARRLASLHRPERCLLSRTDCERLPEVPTFCSGSETPPIYMSPIRAYNIAASVFEALTGCRGINQGQGYPFTPLPGRPTLAFAGQGSTSVTPRSSHFYPDRVRLAVEQGKKSSRSDTVSDIPRSPVQHVEEHHLSASGENPFDSGQNSPGNVVSPAQSLSVSQDNRHHGSNNPHGEMGSMEDAPFSEGFPTTVGSGFSRPSGSDNPVHAGKSPLVAAAEESPQLPFHSTRFMDHGDNGCQQQRLGRSLSDGDSPGSVGFPIPGRSFKCPGTPSCPLCSTSLSPLNIRGLSPPEARQHDSGVLYQETRGHTQSLPSEGSESYHVFGPDEPIKSDSCLSSRSPKCPGGLPLEVCPGQQ